jgi:ligand-binding sensor protein
MTRPLVAFLVSVSVIVGVIVALNRPSRVQSFSCPTQGDLYSRSCANAEETCREDHRAGGGAADGFGFSYVWKCEDGVLTSFTFPG